MKQIGYFRRFGTYFLQWPFSQAIAVPHCKGIIPVDVRRA